MQLLSFKFVLFVLAVWGFYWFALRDRRDLQNLLLLTASYFFYGLWDWRFLLLIVLNSTTDYFIGSRLIKTSDPLRRKLLLGVSLTVNLGLLCFFKYFKFFVDGFVGFFKLMGISLQSTSIRFILPVAISYYTLQTLGYTLDIYKGRTKPTGDLLAFFAYISFFPKLLSGPIERSTTLLPQFQSQRVFDYNAAADGMRLILWGLFKKVVIADNCAIAVNRLFNDPASYTGSTLFVGAILFAIQIYADFSGYSDIAIGIGRLFGFSIMQNFAFPYFSRSITEFWRRWHISLSTWLRDYIFLPFSYSLSRKLKKERYFYIRTDKLINVIAVLVTFLLCGFWHGANFTFILWGLIFGIYLAAEILLHKRKVSIKTIAAGKILPSWRELLQVGITFLMVLFTWTIFRADSISQAFKYISGILSPSFFTMPEIAPKRVVPFIFLLFMVEWLQRNHQHALEFNTLRVPKILRYGIYYLLCLLVLAFGNFQTSFEFFYLKF
jgi:alginate O-acetyltransferase complex protein AlgI